MKIMLHGKNLALTAAIKTFVETKVGSLSRLLEDWESELAEARVEVGKPSRHHKTGFVYYAEVNFRIGSRLLRATEEHLDLHTAVDRARDEVERQIRRYKQKRISIRRGKI